MLPLVAAFVVNSGKVEIQSMSDAFFFAFRFNTVNASLLNAFVTPIFIGCRDGSMSVTVYDLFCYLNITKTFAKSVGLSTLVLTAFVCLQLLTFW